MSASGPSNPGIAIIGAGVVGLTTAIELAERGGRGHNHPVTIFFDPASVAPASAAAPALFTPYPGPDEARFRRWSERSLARLNAIAATYGDESGVSIGALREYFYQQPTSRPWLDALLHTRPIRPIPARCVEATTSTRPHIDMLRYMPWLRSQAQALGVRFVERRVRAIDELLAEGWRTVVDCAGVGARELAADSTVKPMHGQVVHVPNDTAPPLTYSLHDDAQKPGSEGLVAYIFVFRDRLVLGGTFEAGREDPRHDDAAVEGILDRCRELLRIDGHPKWNDLGRSPGAEVRVGVRPTRGPQGAFEWTRVEREQRADGRIVVHNYGHGRSGASFSWATAQEAADLVLGERPR